MKITLELQLNSDHTYYLAIDEGPMEIPPVEVQGDSVYDAFVKLEKAIDVEQTLQDELDDYLAEADIDRQVDEWRDRQQEEEGE